MFLFCLVSSRFVDDFETFSTEKKYLDSTDARLASCLNSLQNAQVRQWFPKAEATS